MYFYIYLLFCKASNCSFSKEWSRNVLFGSERLQQEWTQQLIKFICGCRTKCKLSRQERFLLFFVFCFATSLFMMSCGRDCEWAICLICSYFGIVNQAGRLTAKPDIMSESSVCSGRPCDFSFSPSVLMLREPLHLGPLRVCQKETSDRRKCSAVGPTSSMWREDFRRQIEYVLWWALLTCLSTSFLDVNMYMALWSRLWATLLLQSK